MLIPKYAGIIWWPQLSRCNIKRYLPEQLIVVIDYNPTLYERAKQQFPTATITTNVEQRGISGARNSGVALAEGEIVVFLDDDAAAMPNWLENLIKPYSDPEVVGVGGLIEPIWEKGQPKWFPTEYNWVIGCTYKGTATHTTQIRNMIGCNMSLRREVFGVVGGFSNGIGRIGTRPLGCEETELCIRVSQQWPHKKILYEPNAIVHHHVPAWRGHWKYFQARCYAEGLSKAQITHIVGQRQGLSSERYYVLKTLPAGVVRSLRDVVIKCELYGLSRAATIVAGLVITVFGYLKGLSLTSADFQKIQAQPVNLLKSGESASVPQAQNKLEQSYITE